MDNTLSKDFQDLTLKQWQGEMAAVKQTLNDIVVLLQSTNEKITKISEAIATSNGDSNSNENNNENNTNVNNNNENNNNKNNNNKNQQQPKPVAFAKQCKSPGPKNAVI